MLCSTVKNLSHTCNRAGPWETRPALKPPAAALDLLRSSASGPTPSQEAQNRSYISRSHSVASVRTAVKSEHTQRLGNIPYQHRQSARCNTHRGMTNAVTLCFCKLHWLVVFVVLRFDTLYVNNKCYWYESSSDSVVELSS